MLDAIGGFRVIIFSGNQGFGHIFKKLNCQVSGNTRIKMLKN